MSRSQLHLVALASILPLVSSCALMISGATADVRFYAKPSRGTVVVVGGEERGLGESKVFKGTGSVTFRNPAYGERVVPLERRLNVDFLLLDLLLTPGFGTVGIAVDWPTGAWYRLPEKVSFDFETGSVVQRVEGDSVRTQIAP